MSNLYWIRVVECLVEFHKLERRKACGLARKARYTFGTPQKDDPDIEHVEAFDLACSLAKNDLKHAQYMDSYKSLLQRTAAEEERKKSGSVEKDAIPSFQKRVTATQGSQRKKIPPTAATLKVRPSLQQLPKKKSRSS